MRSEGMRADCSKLDLGVRLRATAVEDGPFDRWVGWLVALVLCLVGWCAAPAPALAAPVFSQVSGSPFAIGSPASVAFSPDGGLLAIANFNADTVSVFSVDSATGALS